MVIVAQLVERRIVVPEVAGSNPVFHPEDEKPRTCGAFLLPGILLDLNAVEVVINPWRLMYFSVLVLINLFRFTYVQ